MKCTSFVAGSLLASAVIAKPHHQHQAIHNKRENPAVVWETEIDYVTETIGITTTIWVPEGYVPPTSAPEPSPSTSSSAKQVPAQFFEPVPDTPKPTPTPATSSAYVAPVPKSTYVAPVVAPAAVAPVQSSSTPEPAPAPAPTPVSVPAPVVAPYVPPPAPSSSSPAAAPESSPATSPSSGTGSTTSGGKCTSGSPCTGDITHYVAGLGACGGTNNGTIDKVVALPFELMGTQSNNNPYCGQTITITHNGKTTTAQIVDKCMGCKGFSIDLSDAAFEEIEDMDVGRSTASWHFN